MSMHDGHRKRLRDRFLKEGLDHFEEINVLELLLFYCIPRIDTNPIAHNLLNVFGSLPNVLEASVEELQKVEGIGESAATFLSLVNSTNRYYNIKKANGTQKISSFEDYAALLKPLFIGRTKENVYILCLDAKSHVISCKKVSEGTAISAEVSVRKIMEMALAANSSSAILAHNHPNGSALPSAEDHRITVRLKRMLLDVDIILVDHLVFSDTECCSILSNGTSLDDFI